MNWADKWNEITSSIFMGINAFSFSRKDPSISGLEMSVSKIKKNVGADNFNFEHYKDFFRIIKELGIQEDFSITTEDEVKIECTRITSFLVNKNNNKTVIFCHGVTNNRWSLFHCMSMVLKMGYTIITYDARNHGNSGGSYNTLGKKESEDLETLVSFVEQKYKSEEIGIYGFSMGAATILFWLSKFQEKHQKTVKFLICEAPFDNFSIRMKQFLEKRKNSPLVSLAIEKLINNLVKSPISLSEINPYKVLPKTLPIPLLLFHGTEDGVIDIGSSLEIFNWFNNSDKKSKEKINLYYFLGAEHGDISFYGEYKKNSVYWKKGEKESIFTFSQLIEKFLNKNF